MEIQSLIELIYWILIGAVVLTVIGFIVAIGLIIYMIRKPVKLDSNEITKSIYMHPDAAKTISKFANRGKK